MRGLSNILKRREKGETGLADRYLAEGPGLGWVGWQWIKGEEQGLEDVSRKSCHGWMSGALGRCGNQGVEQGDAI